MSRTYHVYRWNNGKWHKVVGYDPAFKDMSKNVWLYCGRKRHDGVPDKLEIERGTIPENACAKCFPQSREETQ